MKKLIIACLMLMASTQIVKAQDSNKEIVTDSISVSGICGMCEERIENAALIKGVKKVDWDKDKQMLTVIYRSDKTSMQEIAESIADAGHDSSLVTCTDEQYDKVHSCCKYRENEVH